jgi:hypothetical protein
MKTSIVLLISLLTMLFSTSGVCSEKNTPVDSTHMAALIKAKQLVMRLDIIKATDQSRFTTMQRRILRKETRHIKGDLKELRGGRYVSTMLVVMLFLVPVSVFQLTE